VSKGKAVYLFAGDDEYPLNASARELVNELMPEPDQALGLEMVSGRADNVDEAVASAKRCQEAIQTTGFLFSQGKVVWWRDVSFLADGQTAQSEAVRSQVKALAGVLAESGLGANVLVVTTPKIDRRSALFKLCQDRFEVREFNVPEKAYQAEKQSREIFRAGVKSHGLKTSTETEDLFLGRVGSDTRQIAAELEKLAVYVGGRSPVTPADVRAIVSASATTVMWDLQDAVGDRNLGRALGTVRELLAQKESPIGMVISVFTRIRDLLIYREAMENGWLRLREVAYGNKQAEWGGLSEDEEKALTLALKRPPKAVHPYQAGKLAQQAQRYTLAQLRRNQRLILDTQEKLVSSSVHQATAVEIMLIRMMGPKQ
jgi:DNA polymerase III delta subunit